MNRENGFIATYTNNTERLRIGSDGNVAIGNSSTASAKTLISLTGTAVTGDTDGATIGASGIVNLHNGNSGTNSTVMLLGTTNASVIGQIASGIGFSRESSGDWGTQLRFYTHSTSTSDLDELNEAMRINSSGYVGIGTSSPKLNANGGTFLTVQGTGANGWLELATTSQTDNLGGAITFNNTNVSGTDKRVAQISSLRNGADNKAHLSFATNDGSGQVTRMRISSGGIVTKPYQPAFKASINSTTNRTGVENSVLKTPYDTTQLNVGNHFSTSNNRFTAPVAGNYFFSISQNHIGRHIIYLYKNGAVFHSGEFLHDTGGIWEHSTISAVIPLSANDYVEAFVKIATSTSQAFAWNGGSVTWDSFSGFLIG